MSSTMTTFLVLRMFRSSLSLVAIFVAGSCADPMSTSDGISPTAGVAPRHNMLVQAVNPGAGDGRGANPGAYGPRAARIMTEYAEGTTSELPEADTSSIERE